jgi:hypothetical protein
MHYLSQPPFPPAPDDWTDKEKREYAEWVHEQYQLTADRHSHLLSKVKHEALVHVFASVVFLVLAAA